MSIDTVRPTSIDTVHSSSIDTVHPPSIDTVHPLETEKIEVLILKVDENVMLRHEEGRTRNSTEQLINADGLPHEDPRDLIKELEELASASEQNEVSVDHIISTATREKKKNDKWDRFLASLDEEYMIPIQLLDNIMAKRDEQHVSGELNRVEEAGTEDTTSTSIDGTTSMSTDITTSTSIDITTSTSIDVKPALLFMLRNEVGRGECQTGFAKLLASFPVPPVLGQPASCSRSYTHFTEEWSVCLARGSCQGDEGLSIDVAALVSIDSDARIWAEHIL
ncbi:hypothetical protein F2Q69_00059161 [Brassica cretica]|uniref:Uncharacterized protein n=1 Tax=Brassica cretica TaxID=69181 RepID=A0A8S9RTU9_BRACR|nr:hypothetical protein F2Q69_00059161 [Brassica cretica]